MDNKTKKVLMLGVLLLGCALTSLLGSILGKQPEGKFLSDANSSFHTRQKPDNKNKANIIKVYVSGAVANPGIYELQFGTRADDAVLAAGGMLPEGDETRVNLALKLKDGMQINVPYKKNKANNRYYSNRGKEKTPVGEEAARNINSSGMVNINTASEKELIALPGIGPGMAKRIIDYRNAHRFTRVQDLLKVPGIGKAKLERLKSKITV